MDANQFFKMFFNVPTGGGGAAQAGQAGSAGQSRPTAPKKPRKAVGTPLTRTLLSLLITVVVGAVMFYVTLPAVNLQNEEFYFFIVVLAVVYILCTMILSGYQATENGFKAYLGYVKKQCRLPGLLIAAAVVVCAVGTLASAVIFRAGAYSSLLATQPGDFAAEVDEISYDQIPMLDRDSAERLGDRKLGELSDMVSQFEVASNYTQINYKGRPVRVTPLVYGDIIKWFNNRADGLPAYFVIDMVTQSVEVVRLEEGIRYTTAEHFGRNLYRHLRFQYPTYMFFEPVFEVNEEGIPYWVCPRKVKTILPFGGQDVKGAVLVNAITGESEYLEEVPAWVDNLYSANLIIQQYDYYGRYHNGFINSILGQRDVTVTTEGYNYIAIDDDVYMYTGITSVGGDQSNVGFILSNQRTKQTSFYTVAGATEYSAMDSAQGELQHLRYTATFPLLLNIGGQPTYFMAMKDAAQLVKQYAMVNVQQYTIVATGATVRECEENYVKAMSEGGIAADSPGRGDTVAEGRVAEIRSAVMDGNTVFFIRLEGEQVYYTISAADSPEAVILNVGDRVELSYRGEEGGILEAYSLSVK